MLLASCGGSSVSEKAGQLYEDAVQLNTERHYQAALDLLDSIDSVYPEAIEVRRQAMALRPILLEQLTNRHLEVADSLSAVCAFRLDSMSKLLRLVPNPIENYYVPQSDGATDVSRSVEIGRASCRERV